MVNQQIVYLALCVVSQIPLGVYSDIETAKSYLYSLGIDYCLLQFELNDNVSGILHNVYETSRCR